ncbi:hypothetical protein [Rubrobacter calidifluminis]|uniref:hypothetical protein n=1 Tax=Rubrobacter calidifluminis TaxID=1392640 RepID=UPI00235F8FE5|nr:hypothetical protein [Rubrobacter calidifluminis]
MGENRRSIKHNAQMVRRYLDVWPLLTEKTSRGEAQVRVQHAKGSSSPPVSALFFRFLEDEDNRDASRILSPLLQEILKSGASHRGVSFRALLMDIASDPGAMLHIEHSPRHREALEKMCVLIAHAIASRYGAGRRIHVRLPRACHPARNLHDAAMKRRTWKKEDSYRILANEWAEMVARGIDESEAYRTVAKAHDTSYWRVWRAVEWAKEYAG